MERKDYLAVLWAKLGNQVSNRPRPLLMSII